MSKPEEPKKEEPNVTIPSAPKKEPLEGYGAHFVREDSSQKGALGQPLITINPKDIDAQTRIPSVMAMATHATMAAWVSEKESFTTVEGVTFRMDTMGGAMGLWEFEYKKKAESLDGKSRQEYVDVSKLEAIGPNEDSSLAQSILGEGNKQLNQKDKGKK